MTVKKTPPKKRPVKPNPFASIQKGGFHKWLGKPTGAPITQADINKGLKAGGHPAKMARFAQNAKKFKKTPKKK